MSTKGPEREVIQEDPRKEQRRFRKEKPRFLKLDQRNYKGPDEHKWFIEIPQDEMTLLGAPGGTGKSWMFLYWAERLSKLTNPKTEKLWRVMLWLGEDAAPITYDRLCKLDANYTNMDEPPENIEFIWDPGKPLYRAEHFSMEHVDAKGERKRIAASEVNTTPEMAKLEKRIAAFKPDILFLDPLSVLGPIGFETDNEVCAKFVSDMREKFRGLTVIVSHHSNKLGKDGDDASSLRGSSSLIDGFRHAFTLRLFEKCDDEKDILFLRTVKANYVAPLNTFYTRTITDEGTVIEMTSRKDIDALFGPANVSKKLGEDESIKSKGDKKKEKPANAPSKTTSSGHEIK